MNPPGPFPVHVVGIVRGREVDAMGVTVLESDELVISWPPAAPWRLALEGMDGMAVGETSLTLYLLDHDVLELSGEGSLRALGAALTEAACKVPEVMRGGRSSSLSLQHSENPELRQAHDRWLAPLLSARRALQGISDPERQVALFDGTRLADEMQRCLAEIAAVAAPGAGVQQQARQRALGAALEDEAEGLFRALDRVALAGNVLSGGATDTRFADWRQWIDAVQQAYGAADEAWQGVRELLIES